MINRVCLMAAASLLIAGCTPSSTPPVAPPGPAEQSLSKMKTTFYVAGMNERLQIL